MRADRLLSILLMVQSKGKVTAKVLAERLEVSERTIYRDLDALSSAGVPIYAERGPQGGVALLENYQTQLTGLNENEVQALSLYSGQGALKDLGLSQALESALIKVSAALPKVYRSNLERARARIYLDPTRWFAKKEDTPHLHTFQEAVWEEKKMQLRYWRDQELKGYLLEPYGLVVKAGIWYAVGKTENGLRTFRLARVQEASILPEAFSRPEFDLRDFWQDWVQDFERNLPRYAVSLRIRADALQTLEHHWPHTLDKPKQEKGKSQDWHNITATFESPEQVFALLINLDTEAEIIAPIGLRHQFQERLLRLSNLYQIPQL